MAHTPVHWVRAGLFIVLLAALVTTLTVPTPLPAAAETAVDFPGTVLLADQATGKLAVKKADGGTRFTFVVNEKTKFEGAAKTLADLKKGDSVTVTYVVAGSQYLAQKVVKK